MGLYDILKQRSNSKAKEEKKEILPEGEQVVAQTREEFIDFCESLKKDFRGVIKLYNRGDGKKYTAALLLEAGQIFGASFEDTDEHSIVYREEAINQIKKRLAGTRGDLEAYSFSEKDAQTVRKTNPEALLKNSVPFSSLGMRIKGNIEEKQGFGGVGQSQDAFGVGGKTQVREMKIEDGFRLADFARRLSSAPEGTQRRLDPNEALKKEKEEPPWAQNDKKNLLQGIPIPNIAGETPEAKNERLEALKKKRQMENINIMKRISQITQKRQEEVQKDAGKIETAIDKLYQMVKKYKRLRIDDDLARRIGVSRSQIEGWAIILEEHNLVELHYPAIGEPEIRISEEKKA